MVSCHISCIVCSKKSRPAGLCLLSRGGRVTCSQPFVLHSNRGGAFPCRDPRACSTGENDKPVPQEGVQKQCPSLSWGVHQHCVIYCCRTFEADSGRQLLLPRDYNRIDDHSAFFLPGQVLDGLISCGWEKGSTIEACKAEFQSSVNDQRQLECHASRMHSDISNVVSYLTQQSGFRGRRHLYRLSLVGFQVGPVVVIKH